MVLDRLTDSWGNPQYFRKAVVPCSNSRAICRVFLVLKVSRNEKYKDSISRVRKKRKFTLSKTLLKFIRTVL